MRIWKVGSKSDLVFGLENAGWAVLLVDGTGVILRGTQEAVKLFGPVLEGESPRLSAVWATENGSTAEQFLAQWERSPSPTNTLKFKVKGGGVSTCPVSICSFTKEEQKFFVFQFLPAATSASDEAKNQQDSGLAQKQKLECALQLARTVSLDFNNALTSILGHTSLLLSQMEPNHPWHNSLIEVEKSAARAAEIANDLGAFSRQEKEPRGQTAGNLNSILQRSVEVLQKSQEKIGWSLQLERKLFSTKFDEAKIQQAFVKIMENAMQSVDATGSITVHTRNVELAEPTQDKELRLLPGTYVVCEVEDNGCGIPSDILPRIFEPFFTTKKTEGHRGLGLALVYGIVTNHGGGVAVSSQERVGTSVRVYLPAEKKIVRDTAASSRELNGSQTILMVDDEDLLLVMGQTILSAYGYRVLTANSGQKAMEIFTKSDATVDLVITDVVMPGMGGRELAENIHRISPQTPILWTSGFVRTQNQVESDELTYLQKPFTSQDLLVKVKDILTADIS